MDTSHFSKCFRKYREQGNNPKLQPSARNYTGAKYTCHTAFPRQQTTTSGVSCTTTGTAVTVYPVTDRVAAATEFTAADSTVEAMLESITDVATNLTATGIITDPTVADSPAITDSTPIVTVSTIDPAKIASEAATTHHPMITRSQSTEQEKSSRAEPTSTILQQSQG
jgi:hypothetical protein